MTEIKISDEEIKAMVRIICPTGYCKWCEQKARALVASGWRREQNVLREAADEIERDGGSVLTALWAADVLRERASEAEQYVSAGTREQEDQKRDEEQQGA